MLRVALIGCGEITNMHTDDFNKLSDIMTPVAFCDLVRERAENRSQKCGGTAKIYTDYKVMLDEVELDAVFIAVPPYCHGEIEFDLIERGIPFFVQKPIALDLDLAKRIRDAAAEKGLITAVGLQMRYLEYVEAARKFCQKNKIVHIEATRLQGPRVPATTEEWWHDKKLSGGQLVESGIHEFDQIRYCLGAEVTEVSAFATNGFASFDPEKHTIDDHVTAMLRFDNGALAMIASGICLDKKEGYPTTRRLIFSANDRSAELVAGVGTTIRGEVEATEESVKRDYGELAELREDGAIFIPRDPFCPVNCDRTFLEAVISGDGSKIRSPYADAYKTVAFLLACNESIDSGNTVKVKY